jgi:hypothetical protein
MKLASRLHNGTVRLRRLWTGTYQRVDALAVLAADAVCGFHLSCSSSAGSPALLNVWKTTIRFVACDVVCTTSTWQPT